MAKLPQDTIFHCHSDDGITIMIDEIPLVRCKDCKHWFHDSKLHGDDNGEWRYGECQSDEDFDSPIQKCFLTRETWFCAEGERKNEVYETIKRGLEDALNGRVTEYAPIVRCKDCKWYKDGWCYNLNTFDDEKTRGNTTGDWFCAYGERREE